MNNPLVSASEKPMRRPVLRGWKEAGLALLLLGTVLGATTLHTTIDSANRAYASDAATILALAGVRAFAEHGDARALMHIPVGADSMVMKARVFHGDESSGTYAVRVAHVDASAFRVRSTGRLVSGGKSMLCSLDVFVQLRESEDRRPSLGVEQAPLCNGTRHRSAVASVRNIGS